jgi:hypothetical protein
MVLSVNMKVLSKIVRFLKVNLGKRNFPPRMLIGFISGIICDEATRFSIENNPAAPPAKGFSI